MKIQKMRILLILLIISTLQAETYRDSHAKGNSAADSLVLVAQTSPSTETENDPNSETAPSSSTPATSDQESKTPAMKLDLDEQTIAILNQNICTSDDTVESCEKLIRELGRRLGTRKDIESRKGYLHALNQNYERIIGKLAMEGLLLHETGKQLGCAYEYEIRGKITEFYPDNQIAILEGTASSDVAVAPGIIENSNDFLIAITKVTRARVGQKYSVTGACYLEERTVNSGYRVRTFLVAPIPETVTLLRKEKKALKAKLQSYTKISEKLSAELQKISK